MQKVLFLSSQALFNETRFGGAKRLYFLAKKLNDVAQLSLLCIDGCEELQEGKNISQEFKNHLFLPRPIKKNGISRLEFLPGVKDLIKLRKQSISDFFNSEKFDLTIIAYPLGLRFLDQSWTSHFGNIIYLEDDLLFEQYRIQSESSVISKKLLGLLRYYQALFFYRKKMKSITAFLCISKEEQNVVRKAFPNLPSKILRYRIPLEEFPYKPDLKNNEIYGFIGNYNHPPNSDAVNWLLDEIFPFLLKCRPNSRLILAGRNFHPETIRRNENKPNIKFFENVKNLSEFYNSISTFINPICSGRGMRTKIIESAAYGKPILSTELGAEGADTLKIGIWDTKEQLLERIRELDNPKSYQEIAEYNRQNVEAYHSELTMGNDLSELLSLD